MDKQSTEAVASNSQAPTLKEIQRLAIDRQEAWDRAHDLSMQLHQAIEASGISPTKIAAGAPISRVGIYSLKRQMEARLARERGSSGGEN